MTEIKNVSNRKNLSKGSGALWLIIIIGIGIAIYFGGSYHFVNTRGGIKVYQKSSFTFEDTYVDMESMSFRELRYHKDVLWVMANHGDLEYVPGGETLIKVVRAGGYSLMETVNKFDNEYNISSSIQEAGRITKNTDKKTEAKEWFNKAIGDKGPAGGLIFYDKGSYSDGWRYLEAAPASTEWIKKEWGRYGSLVGGTGKGIGTGQHNTNIIVAWANSQGKKGYAAQLCDALVYGGYSDWFLPSKNELNLMYKNLKVKGVGGFADGRYWSSSEDNHCDAYFQNFEHGGQFRHSKNLQHVRVRAVRAF